MKIKRYYAPDIRQAMKMVREEQGPDAVILSSKKVDGGIEVVAAMDYEDSIAGQQEKVKGIQPGESASEEYEKRAQTVAADNGQARDAIATDDEAAGGRVAEAVNRHVEWLPDPRLDRVENEIADIKSILVNQLAGFAWNNLNYDSQLQVSILKELYSLGLIPDLAVEVSGRVKNMQDSEAARRAALAMLADKIDIADGEVMSYGGICALVGPTGVGKTTTIAKIASRFALRHGIDSVGMVTIDNHRVAAHEQLRTYGRIIGAPVRCVATKGELEQCLADMAGKKLVIIDTAGLSQYDTKMDVMADMLNQDGWYIRKTLVLPATATYMVLDDVINKYRGYGINDVIITKLDEAPSIGAVLSAIITNRIAVSHICDGQQVPEDIRAARAADLVSRCVAVGTRKPFQLNEETFALEFGKETVNA